ncbi:MAG: hypothetical protein MR766_02630 [Erysipelotrichaceae bacterium]|nr:hypothetical protein [Erysipelotrichaceae bacterium]
MKWKIIVTIFSATITSCCSTKRTNYMVPGFFSGINENEKDNLIEDCRLIVDEINKEDFINANGKNVVKDVVKEKYFRLEFYYFRDNERIDYDFINLNDIYKSSRVPVTYEDDSLGFLTPKIWNNEIYYTISLYYSETEQNIGVDLYRSVK